MALTEGGYNPDSQFTASAQVLSVSIQDNQSGVGDENTIAFIEILDTKSIRPQRVRVQATSESVARSLGKKVSS